MVHKLYLCSLVTDSRSDNRKVIGLFFVNDTYRILERRDRSMITPSMSGVMYIDYARYAELHKSNGVYNGIQYQLADIELELDHNNKVFSNVYIKRKDETAPKTNCLGKYPELDSVKFYMSQGKNLENCIVTGHQTFSVLYRLQYASGKVLVRCADAVGRIMTEELKVFKNTFSNCDFSNMILDKNNVLRNYQGIEVEVKTQATKEGKSFAVKGGVEKAVSSTRIKDTGDKKGATIKVSDDPYELMELDFFNSNDVDDASYDSALAKLAYVESQLRKISLYYYTLTSAIPKEVTTSLSTMGVTIDTMYFNADFVLEMSVGELLFVLMHEALHVIFGHVLQSKGKVHTTCNVAQDIYINELLAKDFQIPIGDGVHTIYPAVNDQPMKVVKGKYPDGVLFEIPATCMHAQYVLNHDINVEEVTSLQIYNELMKKGNSVEEVEKTDAGDKFNQQVGQNQSQQGFGGGQTVSNEQLRNMIEKALEEIRDGNEKLDKALSSKVNTNPCSSQEGKDGEMNMDMAIRDIVDGINNAELSKIENAVNNALNSFNSISNDPTERKAQSFINEGITSYMEDMYKGLEQIQKGLADLKHALSAQRMQSPNQNGQQGQDSQQSGQQGQQDGQQGQQGQGSQGEQQNGQQGQGSQGGQSGQDSQGEQQNGQQGQGSQGGQQNGQQGQGTEQNRQGNGEDGSENQQNGSGQGSDDSGVKGADGSEIDEKTFKKAMNKVDKEGVIDNRKRVRISVNGHQIEVDMIDDLMKDTNNKLSDRDRHIKQIDTIRIRQENAERRARQNGKSMGAGCGKGLIERHISFMKAPKINWKRQLKAWMSEREHHSYGYNRPNTKAMARGVISPGRLSMQKKDVIKDIYICIDTSGSMSAEDMGKAFYQIDKILKNADKKHFRAVLIYWDAGIENIGEFHDIKELLKIKSGGGGGTDITEVFQYLAGERAVKDEKGKVWSTKPKDVKGILVFTDGFLYDTSYAPYGKYFDRKTMWVIDGGSDASHVKKNIVFGTIAEPDLND